MWAATPLMAWYCDQSHLIIRKRWTLSQSFTWFPLLPAPLFYSFCLLPDTCGWFYSFITLQWVLAVSRYFLPRISEFNVDSSYGDAGVILRPWATCHRSSDLLWLPVGRIDLALMRACWERRHLANFVEKTWIFSEKERKKEWSEYPSNSPVQWSVNALCSSRKLCGKHSNEGIRLGYIFSAENDRACSVFPAHRQKCVY